MHIPHSMSVISPIPYIRFEIITRQGHIQFLKLNLWEDDWFELTKPYSPS